MSASQAETNVSQKFKNEIFALESSLIPIIINTTKLIYNILYGADPLFSNLAAEEV